MLLNSASLHGNAVAQSPLVPQNLREEFLCVLRMGRVDTKSVEPSAEPRHLRRVARMDRRKRTVMLELDGVGLIHHVWLPYQVIRKINNK